jgi:hypothetical protein
MKTAIGRATDISRIDYNLVVSPPVQYRYTSCAYANEQVIQRKDVCQFIERDLLCDEG